MSIMSGSPCLHYDCSNRNSFGYCRTTVCINEHYQQEQCGSPSTTNKSESVVKKPQTKADLIRAMSDEELAEWLELKAWDLPWCNDETPVDDETKICSKWDCVKCALEWLKQEAET